MDTHEYVLTSAGPLSLDVYQPKRGAGTELGTVVYLHGGGFAVGDRSMDQDRIRALAAEGLRVAVPDYRLAPNARFPDQVDDVRAAIAWIRSHLDVLGTTNARVALWGASAGAVLASLVALSSEKPADVAAVVSWFGFSDMATSASRSPLEAAILPAGPEYALLGVDDLAAVPDLVRAASPIRHVSASSPPFLIAHGDRDHVVALDESRQLHDALARAGARSTLMILGTAGHEDPRFDAADTIGMTAAFLRSHLRAAGS